MAMSPAKAHFQRATAALEAAATGPDALMEGLTGYEVQLAKLQQDEQRLKQVQSTEGKATLKIALLPEYVPYVEGVIASGQGAQDDVIVTVMLWRFDAGDYVGGLEVADYVLKHGLKMTDRFKRTAGCVVAEEVAEVALNAMKAGTSFDMDILTRTNELTAAQDMPDQVRAKLYLAMGRLTAAQVNEETPAETDKANLEAAKQYFSRAIELHDKCGAKKDQERVDRLLKRHAGPAS